MHIPAITRSCMCFSSARQVFWLRDQHPRRAFPVSQWQSAARIPPLQRRNRTGITPVSLFSRKQFAGTFSELSNRIPPSQRFAGAV